VGKVGRQTGNSGGGDRCYVGVFFQPPEALMLSDKAYLTRDGYTHSNRDGLASKVRGSRIIYGASEGERIIFVMLFEDHLQTEDYSPPPGL
jgi:hypothetical protein